MATQVQLRRGNAAEVSIAVGAEGELFFDTSLDQIVVQDGSTIGGIRVIQANVDAIFDDDSILALSGSGTGTHSAIQLSNSSGEIVFHSTNGLGSTLQIRQVGGFWAIKSPAGGVLDLLRVTDEGEYTGPSALPPGIIAGTSDATTIASTGWLATSRSTAAAANHHIFYSGGNGPNLNFQTEAAWFQFAPSAASSGFRIRNIGGTGNLFEFGIAGNLAISALLPTQGNHLTRMDYVDDENATQNLVIAANTSAIGDNAGDIGDNTTAIGVNAGLIGGNTTAIGTNTGNITTLQGTAPNADEKAAMPGGSPTAGNRFATLSDIGAVLTERGTQVGTGTFVITGLTPFQPAYFIGRDQNAEVNGCQFQYVSGTVHDDFGGANSRQLCSVGASQAFSSNDVFIPNATTVTISISVTPGGRPFEMSVWQ